jgi:hypothetical protein
VGLYDNFFDLGGDSMLAVRVHGKLQETLRCNISIVKMFEYPTVAALAAFVSQEAAAATALQSDERSAPRRGNCAVKLLI